MKSYPTSSQSLELKSSNSPKMGRILPVRIVILIATRIQRAMTVIIVTIMIENINNNNNNNNNNNTSSNNTNHNCKNNYSSKSSNTACQQSLEFHCWTGAPLELEKTDASVQGRTLALPGIRFRVLGFRV